MKHTYTLLDIHPLSLNLHTLKCWSDAQIMWNNVISDKPKHKNSNKIPGFNQITICDLRTANYKWILPHFLSTVCYLSLPFSSMVSLHFCLLFSVYLYVFLRGCSYQVEQLIPGGGGGGGGGGSRHACSHSFGVFSCLLEIHEICWAARNMDFVSNFKSKNKKQQPRLKKNWCGNLSESLFGHTVCAKATHIQFCSWKVSLHVQKTQSKKGVLLDFPQRDHHILKARMGRHLQQGFKSAVQCAWICRLTPAALMWAVKHVPADTCRTDVSSQACLNLMTDTCPTPVSSEACLNLPTDTCRTASDESEMVPTAQEIILWTVICHHHE